MDSIYDNTPQGFGRRQIRVAQRSRLAPPPVRLRVRAAMWGSPSSLPQHGSLEFGQAGENRGGIKANCKVNPIREAVPPYPSVPGDSPLGRVFW
jgi:hypothetical protein